YVALTQSQQKHIDDIERPYRQKLHAAKLAQLSEEAQVAHRTAKEKRTVEMENQIQETADQLKITEAELFQGMSQEDRTQDKALREELRKIPKPAPLPQALVLQKGNDNPAPTFVLFRGDYNNPREEVPPGFPAILRSPTERAVISVATNARRAALAGWIANADNP